MQGYYVGYRVQDAKESFAYKTLEARPTSASGHQECDLNDLRKNTRYTVVVQAFNSKGAGPSSEEVFSQTLEIGETQSCFLVLLQTFIFGLSCGICAATIFLRPSSALRQKKRDF